MRRKKNNGLFLLVLCLLTSCWLLTAGEVVFADGVLELDDTSVTFEREEGTEEGQKLEYTVWAKNDTVKIRSVSSDNEEVATVTEPEDAYKYGDWVPCFTVIPQGTGTCTVTVVGENDQTIELPVTVDISWIEAILEQYTRVTETWYGSPEFSVRSCSGAKGTLTVGSDTYEVSISEEEYYYGYQTIAAKRNYKLKTAVTLKLEWKGASYSWKGKITSMADVVSIEVNKKKPKKAVVECGYLTKGDIVSLTYKGKTYKTTYKKAGKPSVKLTFTLKSKLKKNSKITVRIQNKYKQQLYKTTVKLSGWSYMNPDYADDDDDDDDSYTD